jgi:hypothetical protein
VGRIHGQPVASRSFPVPDRSCANLLDPSNAGLQEARHSLAVCLISPASSVPFRKDLCDEKLKEQL